jgi:hypothetical protein
MMDVDDGRIGVRFGAAEDAGPEDALLIESVAPGAGEAPGDHVVPPGGAARTDRPPLARFTLPVRIATHPLGCACCTPRSPVAEALGRLFLARARSELPWFRSVVAVTHSAAGADAVRAALIADVVTTARFRADP